MATKILESEWRRFSEVGISPRAPITARAMMQRAFYAGAQSCYIGLFNNMLKDDGGECLDPAVVENLKAEFVAFWEASGAKPAVPTEFSKEELIEAIDKKENKA